MRSKALASQTVLEMPRKWAKRCQISGQSLFSYAQIRPEDRKEYRGLLTTWWLCQLLVTAVLLIALVGCGSGSSGSGGGGNPNPPNAVPAITSVTPPNTNAGSGVLAITVNGQGFVSTSTVQWNGSNRATTEMSATQLTADLTAADVAAAGAAQITVVNPAPGGGMSNPVGFVINGTEPAAIPAFVYVANSIGVSLTMGNISAFTVDPNTGVLTPIPGSPFQGGAQPTSLAVDPTGKFLYEASDLESLTASNDIFAFAINATTGALTPVPGSPFSTGTLSDPVSLTVDSTGKFLYVADFQGDTSNPSVNNISEFSINASTGALAPAPQGGCPPSNNGSGLATAIVADPTAQFIFASSVVGGSGIFCSFSINSGGVLEPVTGSPVSLPTNPITSPKAMGIDPLGKFVYAANSVLGGPFNVSAFAIAPNSGELNPVLGSPFETGQSATDSPTSLSMDPLGRFLYIANFADVPGYSINTNTGALSMLGGFPFTGQNIIPQALTVDPSGKFLYMVTQNPNSQGNSVPAYAIDQTTGGLTPVSGSPFPDADGTPVALIVVRKP